LAYLLNNGADINAEDAAGWTAVMWAAAGGYVSTVEFLHTHGACMKPKTGDWDTLMVAAAAGHYKAVEWLLAKGAKYQTKNHAKKDAAKLAFENGHDDIADLLGRIGEINKWHAENERKGRLDADARAKALRDEATKLAKADAKMSHRRVTEELIQKHVSELSVDRFKEEKIAKLRDIMTETKEQAQSSF
jgi:ankyrin repeat protein